MTPAPPRAPSVRTLRPGLHLLETEVEDFDVRAAVIVGETRAVVWDTLAHPVQMEGAAALAGELPVTVVYSHVDWDHAWGTAGLGTGDAGAGGAGHRWDAVVAHEAAAARFASDVPGELEARRRAEPGAWDAVRLVPPTVTFARELTLELGGVTLHLHALSGHTPDCVVGFVPEWGVLLAGDTVETPLPVVNDGGAVAAWADGLLRWRDDGAVTQVVPSHGRIGGRDVVVETESYLRELLAGRAPDPGAVPPFYRETHARNARAVEEATGGTRRR